MFALFNDKRSRTLYHIISTKKFEPIISEQDQSKAIAILEGINNPEQVELIDKIDDDFYQIAQQEKNKALPKEIIQQVGIEIKNLLHQYGVNTSVFNSKVIWNSVYSCWEYSGIILDGNSSHKVGIQDNQLSPARQITVRLIKDKDSFHPKSKDYIDRANNLFSIIENVFCKDLSNTHLEIKTILNAYINSSEYVGFKQFILDKLKDLDPYNSEQHQRAVGYLQFLTNYIATRLAAEVKSAIITNSASMPDNKIDDYSYSHPKYWLNTFKNLEAELDSEKKREILLHVYPIEANSDHQGITKPNDIWVMDMAVPMSDIPSTLRTGALNVLPNWYISKNKFFSFDESKKLTKVTEFDLQRSSSFSPIAIKEHDSRQQIAIRIAENKLKSLVIEDIINKINTFDKQIFEDEDYLLKLLEVIKKCFKRKMVVMTFLNLPFKFISNAALNENMQFQLTKKSFQKLPKGLKLSGDDINFILDHINNSSIKEKIEKSSDFRENLQKTLNSRISHKEIFHNFASSGGRRFSQGGWLSIFSARHQKRANGQAFKLITSHIVRLIETSNPNLILPIRNAKIFKKIPIDLKKITVNDINIENMLLFLRNNHTMWQKDSNLKYKKILALYLKYINLLKTIKNNKKDENFLIQVFTALLTKEIGLDLHITCKSGEDRTGAIKEAINCAHVSLINLDLFNSNQIVEINEKKTWQKFKQEFWDRYVDVLKCSTSYQITGVNAIGAKGIQSNHNNNQVSNHPFMQVSNKMARIHKHVFHKMSNRLYKHLAKKFSFFAPKINQHKAGGIGYNL